jgi:DNA polymerase III subunit delta
VANTLAPVASADIKSAYLIAGSDEAKIGAALRRLRARAETEGGAGALEVFEPAGSGGPDADAVVGAIPALSLTAERRYLLADRIERWGSAQAGRVADALAEVGPETTVVLIARGKPPAKLAKAVKQIGGEVLTYDSPRERDLPARLVSDARQRGFELEVAAARLLVERMGTSTMRLANELDRLALWAGPGGEVTAGDLEAMIADTSQEAAWSLSDAVIERRADAAALAVERLIAQGEGSAGLVYALASRLRNAHAALTELEAGRSPKQAASSLDMHPYAASMLVKRLRGASLDELRAGIAAVADLEVWSRGGSDYEESVALTLAVRRAAGAAASDPG